MNEVITFISFRDLYNEKKRNCGDAVSVFSHILGIVYVVLRNEIIKKV